MTTLSTSRQIPYSPQQIFAAFEPTRLAKWWGPKGFTNTFDIFEFKNQGRWSFTMNGPDGKNYTNENRFEEIQLDRKVIVRHVSEPKFVLTIELVLTGQETLVKWDQLFENDEVAKSIKHICVPANEENLDRLAAEVLGDRATTPQMNR